MTQNTLQFPPADPHALASDAPRLSRQSRLILERLKRGPASNLELWEYSRRVSARIYDLRKAGHQIASKPGKNGVWIFWIVGTEL